MKRKERPKLIKWTKISYQRLSISSSFGYGLHWHLTVLITRNSVHLHTITKSYPYNIQIFSYVVKIEKISIEFL